MVQKSFGGYLVERNLITQEQHDIALRLQNKNRLLGEIAVEENYLTRDEVAEISEYEEKNPGIKFGEAAITLGYLNTNQVRFLLDIRTRRKVRIGDILVRKGFITEDALNKELLSFEEKGRKLKTVLLCDPMKSVVLILKRMLEKYHYEVLESSNAVEAMQLAVTKKPDILITSVVLEGMDGYKLCYKLLSDPTTAGMSFVIISSDISKEAVSNAFDVGVNHFLAKPVRETELINILYQLEREESEKRPEKILIVDDSPGARMIIYKELSAKWGHIHMAENGARGVEKAKEVRPDIITMDMEMPVMNGLDACRKLKEDPLTKNIPVVIVTASDSEENRRRGFESGAVEYFQKPFKSSALAAFLQMLLESKKIEKKERVLLVEDSITTLHILKYYFEKNGFNVTTATNGREALDVLNECGPDIIVTDCFMPVMDGFGLTQEIRKTERFHHTPIIMLTAATSKEDTLRGLAVGASDYMVKPFDESELFARIGVHLRNQKLLLQLEAEKEKLEEANENLDKVNREKDKFLSIAAHDLRNPLSSIMGIAQVIADEEGLDDDTKELIKMIHCSSKSMQCLLEELLDIQKITSGKAEISKQVADMNEIVNTRVKLSEFIAKQKQIAIHYECREDVKAGIDIQKMEQVIDNLLSNAIKFTHSGNNIFVSLERSDGMAKVAVRDEGQGIPDSEQSKLFTPFCKLTVRPTGNETSTGLGLSICASIIRAHGGTIGADSKKGEGSTFYFLLPAA